MDLTMVNLDDVLPQATIMVVSVTASTTSGQPLSPENLQIVLDAADVALQLDEDKSLILQLVQQKMHKIAPNLSTAVGTEVAARLMGVAGGLINLSKMPACNVQVCNVYYMQRHVCTYPSTDVSAHRFTPPGLHPDCCMHCCYAATVLVTGLTLSAFLGMNCCMNSTLLLCVLIKQGVHDFCMHLVHYTMNIMHCRFHVPAAIEYIIRSLKVV